MPEVEIKPTRRLLGGGVMYTGRKNLELGATIYHESFETDDLETTTLFMILNMRYFF